MSTENIPAPRITSAVLSRLLAPLRAETLRAHDRGEIPTVVHRAVVAEIEDLERLRARGRAPEDPSLFREWIDRRHKSLPETRERRAVEAMLRRLGASATIYADAFEDGAREARDKKRPSVLAPDVGAA